MKSGYLSDCFLEGFLSWPWRWYLPAPPQQEGNSANPGLVNPMPVLLLVRVPKSFSMVTATLACSTSPYWLRLVFHWAQTVWFLPYSSLKYTLMREDMILLNGLLSSPFSKSQLYREEKKVTPLKRDYYLIWLLSFYCLVLSLLMWSVS